MAANVVGIGLLAVVSSWLMCGAARCESGDRLDRSRLSETFSEEFDGPLSWCSDDCHGERWRTKYFHSGDSPMSRGLGVSSASEVAMDPKYLSLGINPFKIKDGVLAVEVRPADAATQQAVRRAWPPWYKGERLAPRFTSGLLTTQFSFKQLYGYFEARVKVPRLTGGWPAFWLLGPEGTYNEIDIFEILTGLPHVHRFGQHWGRFGRDKNMAEIGEAKGSDLSDDFHVYGALWTEREIVYYRDDLEVGRFTNKDLHEPMYIILSIGMDGSWNTQLDLHSSPSGSGDMLIDFVRAYRVN